MNQTQTRSLRKKVLSLILAVVMAVSLLPISAFASGNSKASSDTADSSYKYNIMFLDCGRKYFSVDSIKKIIDNASAAGFNYIQLAVGSERACRLPTLPCRTSACASCSTTCP